MILETLKVCPNVIKLKDNDFNIFYLMTDRDYFLKFDIQTSIYIYIYIVSYLQMLGTGELYSRIQILKWLSDISSFISYLHCNQINHGKLTINSLFFSKSGTPLIGNFKYDLLKQGKSVKFGNTVFLQFPSLPLPKLEDKYIKEDILDFNTLWYCLCFRLEYVPEYIKLDILEEVYGAEWRQGMEEGDISNCKDERHRFLYIMST